MRRSRKTARPKPGAKVRSNGAASAGADSTCSAPDCKRPVIAHGLCGTHYAAQRRRAQGVEPRTVLDDSERVTVRVPGAQVALVAVLAEREGVDVSEWLRRAIAERAERQANPRGAWVGPLPPEG